MLMRTIIIFLLLIWPLQAADLFGTIRPEDYLQGKFSPDSHSRLFILVPQYMANKKTYLRRDVFKAYKAMYKAARRAGFKLVIVSGFRSFNHQKSIWERKARRYARRYPNELDVMRQILRFSAMPGTSRHHWGTEIDLNSLQNSYFAKGYGRRLYEWLINNGPEYGFYKVYTSGRVNGYSEEKWHYSYMPVARRLHQKYLELVTPSLLKGFYGDSHVEELFIIPFYVNGINKKLLPAAANSDNGY